MAVGRGSKRKKKVFNDTLNLVKEIEKLAESRPLSSSEMDIWNNGINRIMEMERFKALDLKQKARIKWTIDGDENNKFFSWIH